MMVQEIDWAALNQAAKHAQFNAYVPYSNYPVGAAGLTADGRIVSGCNVENASYGLTLCAECSMISDLYRARTDENGNLLFAEGHGDHSNRDKLVAVVILDQLNQPLAPCSRCRQLISEHGEPGCLIQTAAGLRTIEQLLPDAFGPRDLAAD